MLLLIFLCNSQVVGGGQKDIDVTVLGPSHNIVYSQQRKEYDQVQFNTTVSIPKRLKFIEMMMMMKIIAISLSVKKIL